MGQLKVTVALGQSLREQLVALVGLLAEAGMGVSVLEAGREQRRRKSASKGGGKEDYKD